MAGAGRGGGGGAGRRGGGRALRGEGARQRVRRALFVCPRDRRGQRRPPARPRERVPSQSVSALPPVRACEQAAPASRDLPGPGRPPSRSPAKRPPGLLPVAGHEQREAGRQELPSLARRSEFEGPRAGSLIGAAAASFLARQSFPPAAAGSQPRQAGRRVAGCARGRSCRRPARGPGSLRRDSPPALACVLALPGRMPDQISVFRVHRRDHRGLQLAHHVQLHYAAAQLQEHRHAAGGVSGPVLSARSPSGTRPPAGTPRCLSSRPLPRRWIASISPSRGGRGCMGLGGATPPRDPLQPTRGQVMGGDIGCEALSSVPTPHPHPIPCREAGGGERIEQAVDSPKK